MSDQVQTIGASLIQHGKHNDRIYLMKLADEDRATLFETFDRLIAEFNYSKIFAKIKTKHLDTFLDRGFVKEAEMPSTVFVSRFIDPKRLDRTKPDVLDAVLDRSQSEKELPIPDLAEGFEERLISKRDADVVAKLYAKVFASYPFPIDDPKFILESMNKGVRYYGIQRIEDDALVALSSSEPSGNLFEMTDFATDPDCRGLGFARRLLKQMEDDLKGQTDVLFTIARGLSMGMNLTFRRGGYSFGGSLVNNTQIFGDLETMNVWYKEL